MFSILTFDKNEYDKLLKNIEKSRGYLSYIDSKEHRGHSNKRYDRYLEYKNALYNLYPNHNHINEGSLIISVLEDESISKEKIDEYYELYGVQDDYYVEYESIEVEGTKSTIYYSIPNECKIFDRTLELDNHFERINRDCLSDDFVMNGHRRFTLLPFQSNVDDHFIESYIIANIYEIGIITLHLIVNFKHDRIPQVTNIPPRCTDFESVSFYKRKQEYKINDFWEREIKNNISIDEIMSYYEDYLRNLSSVTINGKRKNRKLSWYIGDYKLNRKLDHFSFIKQNKKLIVYYLNNGTKEFLDRYKKSQCMNILNEANITKNKDFSYYVTPTSSVMIASHSAYLEFAKINLSHLADLLQQEGVYEEELISDINRLGLIAMLEYLRFYELTLIKQYFLTQILDDISQKSYETLKEFNDLKSDINFLKIKYDEDVLFFTEGSQKELYKQIVEKNKVNILLSKVENMIDSISEDINNKREIEIQNNEVLILIISSILTIILSYRGIKVIVYEVLVNLPCIGLYIDDHPFRYTIAVWGILITLMIYLNIKRLFVTKHR